MQQNAWDDKNIEAKYISLGDLVLLYDSRIKGKPRKLETAWLGSYIVEEFNENGSFHLKMIQGQIIKRSGKWRKTQMLSQLNKCIRPTSDCIITH